MKRFAELFADLDATTSTSAKVTALQRYLGAVDDADAAWAVYFLSGGKPRQLIKTAQLRALAEEASGLPAWLFDASYQAVGDLAETISLVLPLPQNDAGMNTRLSAWMEERLLPLRGQGDDAVCLVLGVSPGSVNALHHMPLPAHLPQTEQPIVTPASSFAARLAQLTKAPNAPR